jgi:hypothetical protein
MNLFIKEWDENKKKQFLRFLQFCSERSSMNDFGNLIRDPQNGVLRERVL